MAYLLLSLYSVCLNLTMENYFFYHDVQILYDDEAESILS